VEDLEARVRTLPPDSVVFFSSFHFDGTGRHFVPRDVLRRVASFSPAPMIGVSATMVGHGLAAGGGLDYPEIGGETARLTLELMDGKAPQRRDPDGFSRLVADDRELRRFHVPESRVPAGGTVLFRPPSLWRDHPKTMLAATVALVLQTGLIVTLLL